MKKIITIVSILIILLFAGGSMFGQTWSTIGSTGLNGSVKCLITDNTNNVVYAGGAFTTADGATVNYIAKWNGTTWAAVGAGFNNTVWALTFYNNELYAGGSFTLSGSTTVNGLAKWNGNAWVAVGTGVTGGLATVDALCVFNNELYVGGWFSSAGGAATSKNMAKWNGTTYTGVGGGMYDGVMTLTVFNNALYAGGYFVVNNITFSLQYRIAKLSGTTWVNVGSKGVGDANAYWGVRTMAVYNNALFAAGYFTLLDDGTTTANHVAKWSGTAWSVLGSGSVGITTTSSTYVVNSSCVYANSLYLGGTFTGAGGATANYIATWNGTAWGTAGTGLDGAVNAMTVYNNDLIVAGDFANAGGSAATRIAKWHVTGAGLNEISSAKSISSNFPNPFSTSTMITVSAENELQNAELTVYDILGNETAKLSGINTNSISLERNGMPAGVYFYAVKENNALVASGKLVIE